MTCQYPYCIGAENGTVCRVDCQATPKTPARLTDEVIGELWHKSGGHYHRFAREIESWVRTEMRDAFME